MNLDVPEGVVLCECCHDDLVWWCDRCGRQIASPDVDGGQLMGFTPIENEDWCEQCREETIATCTRCRREDLIEDMEATNDSLLCDTCVSGHTPEEDISPLLTIDNWQKAAMDSLQELPGDFRESVGYSTHSFYPGESIEVMVACEAKPGFGGRESLVDRIEITYWNSTQERNAHIEGDNWETHHLSENQLQTPIVVVDGCMVDSSFCFYVEKICTVNMLKNWIQVAILESMFSFSAEGMSSVGKDKKGRFIRNDGTRILEWQ